MRKFIYYLAFLLLLFIISSLPTSAKEISTCTRSFNDLKVRDELINSSSKSAIIDTPCVDKQEKVYDFADLLSDLEEENLYTLIDSYIKKNNYDLAIVTTFDNNKSVQDYADDFYDYNDFGFSKTHDGLLFLIDMNRREVYLTTTGYAIKMYDDQRIEEIIDAGYNYLKQGNYYQAFEAMILKTNYYFEEGYPKSNSNLLIDAKGKPYYLKKMPYLGIILISALLTSIVSLICYFKTRLKLKAISTVSYLKTKELTLHKDTLVNTIVTHTPRYDTTSSNNSSGGSTFHSGSSGTFHGGGGRHF